ncbi:MAG: ATP-binding protein [Lachnospiraceae bacterium]|nr:ATP-binding protein [Lachnospiraceae bacterium]
MERNKRKVPKRIAAAVINSLKGGVVPRLGLPYITVGRKHEIEALLHDVDVISEGGASFRFIEGKYGSGKSFLLQTIRSYVMDRNFVVVDADLSPERRLQGTRGQGLATYRELVRNMSTKTRPEGGALPLILDRWMSGVEAETAEKSGLAPGDTAFEKAVETNLMGVIRSMQELVHGFDFARLLTMYYRASVTGDDETKGMVLKWFRGEYATKTEAKRELGVTVIITDDDWYDYLKLFAWFLVRAGYSGLYIMIDELVNIYKIPNAITRQYNYEKMLTMYNDTMQGKARYLGILMSGTPQCVEDRRRGIYSYEALRSRLADGKFSKEGARDLLAPVIHLEPLTAEEMLVLTGKLAEIHAELYGYEVNLTDQDLAAFIQMEYARIGADRQITPREVIRDFIELLDLLYQHPGKKPADLLGSDEFSYSKGDLASQEEAALAPDGTVTARDELAGNARQGENFAEFQI